jgi:hypothetical protein
VGPRGQGITVSGSVASAGDLPATTTAGLIYFTQDTGDMWVSSGNGQAGTAGYTNIGHVQGPEGPQGPAGPAGSPGSNGATGASAFAIYKANGGDLATEAEWLASLEGPPGQDADLDPDILTGVIQSILSQLIGLGSNDLLSVDAAGKLFAPVLPGSKACRSNTNISPTATTEADAKYTAMNETITNPSSVHALKVDVSVGAWVDTNAWPTVSNNPPAFYINPALSGGTAIQVGESGGREETAGTYVSMWAWSHYIIPPGGSATFCPALWVSSVGSDRIFKYVRLNVVPIGYEAAGSSTYRVVGGAPAAAGTAVTRPPTTARSAASTPSSNSVQTYRGTGAKRTDWDGRRLYYGQYDGTQGDQRSIALFSSSFRSTLRSIGAGKVTSMKLTFTNQHTFPNAGGSVKVYLATEASIPGTLGGASGTLLGTVTVPHSGSASLTISGSNAEAMRASGTGVKFYAATGGQAGYGYLDGLSVKLAVNYQG